MARWYNICIDTYEEDYVAFPNLQKIFAGIDVGYYFETNGVLYRPMGFYFKK